MDMLCPAPGGGSACTVRALAAGLHSLHLYCVIIFLTLIWCCAPAKSHRHGKQWRAQNVRGVANLAIFAVWLMGVASAALRPTRTVQLVSASMAVLAWFAAAAFHVLLWSRASAAPTFYLAIYWLMAAASSSSIVWQHTMTQFSIDHIEIYIHTASALLALIVFGVDCLCFYDEVTNSFENHEKISDRYPNISYTYNYTHFFSKITFFWLNRILYKGYESPLDESDLGELPENELPRKYFEKFRHIFYAQNSQGENGRMGVNLWRCYVRMIWPNFYIAGVMKLFGDVVGIVPPLGLAVIIQFVEREKRNYDENSHVTVNEFFTDGYIMLMIVTVALVTQAFLSQNSTHLVTVEGARLKITLQSMLYEKCMRLAPWALRQTNINEESPLLQESNKTTTQSGLLTNLVSQDTYNIMSCVWVCHYIWAIPLKLIVLLYLLYTKLGISAIIGSTASVLFITPLQFYIGHKISKNSKDISQSTDHRISKMMEILRGINVIKLYVWEDLFKEKILNVREVELKLLNKDSLYWSFLTFTTQVSTLLVTVITFTVYYFVEDDNSLTAYNVFAGLALFNQLSVPLLILPVTVLMVIQAVVSTKRIKDFLELPESNNVAITNYENTCRNKKGLTKLNNAFVAVLPDDSTRDETEDPESGDKFSDDDLSPLANDKREYVVHFRNAAFSWGYKNDSMLEIDDLDIPSGKLIMIVGPTGAGKTSLLSAILGEMYLERGDAHWKGDCSMWYAGQPPWLLEGSVRENIVMDRPWNQRKYARIVRSTGLQPDLQLLPEGDNTPLGSNGEPLSGGQRVRVCVARALYSGARLLALDEPLGALDAALARRVVARALVPAARAGRTVLLATNRLEVLHYADVVIAMEGGCVTGCGRAWPAGAGEAVLSRWAQLAGEARAAAARGGAGPPGGSARERMHCVRALNRAKFQRVTTHDSLISISSATGAHFLPEVPACAGGSWRRDARARHALTRQFSSPPPSFHNYRCRQEVRRAVSADPSSAMLQRQVSLARRLLQGARQPRRTLARWTPKTFRRFLSTNSQTEENQTTGWSAEQTEANWSETTDISATTNGMNEQIEQSGYKIPTNRDVNSELKIWWEYGRACGCWGAAFWVAAAAAQGLALAADCWLTHITGKGAETPLSSEQKWNSVLVYGALCLCGACVAGAAQAAQAAGGAAARRALHERLLQAALHSPPAAHAATPIGLALHRFSADVLVIDKKLPTALSRWAQLVLLCGAAVLVNAVAAPWTLLALLPAIFLYFAVQSVYLCNARELQHDEARSAAEVVSLAAQTAAGAGTVRAGRLQARMNDAFMTRLARNHNVLLILNSANRWLGLTMDLVGAGSVCVSVGVAVCGGGGGGGEGAVAGLAGAYSLLLPAYLAHLAKCRADLDQQLAAVERVSADTRLPQEDYREDCPIPSDWKREGKIQFENVTVQHEPGMPTILQDISLSISPGEKVVICGRSGSGKSSLLLACAGAAAVRRGRLLVDGRDAASVPLRALRRRVVLLPQEPHMFSGTLRENLDPLAVHTDDEIWQSLRAVGLQEFVAAQPAGLECIVCESGTACGGGGAGGWSGTRAARACGARAALRARWAGALLLDEPGAALDAAAERALLAALAAQAPAATVITVAHRVSSVRGYDRAVVLERGRVVEQGAVEELLAQPASRLARMLAAAQHTH